MRKSIFASERGNSVKFCTLNTDSISLMHQKTDSVPENMNSTHCHDRYEILYVAQGGGKYVVEGVEYPVKPRSLMIFPPLSYHCVHVDSGVEYERFVLMFDKRSVADCAMDAFNIIEELAQVSGAFYPPEAVSDSIIATLERFEAILSLPDAERDKCARLLLSELLIFLSVERSEFYLRDDGELGARVIKYLNQNMNRDISLDMLAKRFFVSKYYLCRAFKKHNGISVHGYINRKRVMYAKQLIESGETASGAAYRVGFGDYSAFYRAYVKIVGRSPTQQEERSDDEIHNS